MRRTATQAWAVLVCAALLFVSLVIAAQPQDASLAGTKYLDVPDVKQEQSEWCWAGCARSLFLYYGQDVAQCEIANFNWGRTDCCTNPGSTACNNWTWIIPNVQDILWHWNVASNALWSSASFSTVQTEIDADRPVWARWAWSGGGGHFLLIRGYNDDSGSKVFYMDPWYGESYLTDYSWMVSGGNHEWTHSLTGLQYLGTTPTLTPTATSIGTATATTTPPLARERVYLPVLCKAHVPDGTVTPTPPVTPTATPTGTETPTATPTQPPVGPIEVPVSTDSADQLHPAVAYSQQHSEYLVVWQDDGKTDVFAQRVSGAGHLRGARIDVSTAPLLQQRPAAAHNSQQDEYLIIWQDGTGEASTSGHNYIHGQRLSWDGQRVGGLIQISKATEWQVEAAVAYNAIDNEYLVVWRDGVVDVHGQRLSASGDLLGARLTICSASRQQNYPAVTHNPDANEYLVVWDDHRPNMHYDIYAARITADGVVAAEIALCTLPGDQRRPKVAFSSSTSGYLVAWPDYRNNPSRPDFCGQLVAAQGQLMGGVITLSTAGSGLVGRATALGATSVQSSAGTFATIIHENTAIAFDPVALQYVVVWPDRGARDIRAGYLQPGGGTLHGKFTVCPAPGEQREPAIAVNGANGGFLIAWQDQRSGRDFDIYAYVQP